MEDMADSALDSEVVGGLADPDGSTIDFNGERCSRGAAPKRGEHGGFSVLKDLGDLILLPNEAQQLFGLLNAIVLAIVGV